MDALLIVDMKVPKHISVGRIRCWVSLVASIHGGKLDRVTNKEDRLEGFSM